MENLKDLTTRVMLLQTIVVGLLDAFPPQLKVRERISALVETAEMEASEDPDINPPSVACPDLVALLTGREFP